jgi:threonine synthase
MRYISTRDTEKTSPVPSAVTIKQGIAGDGGLFVPESIPGTGQEFIESLIPMDYASRAAAVLGLYLDDYGAAELADCCRAAYSSESFSDGPAPVSKLGDGLYSLELWHGPTCAFKDLALQLMPRLLSLALDKTAESENALVLVATSGDTGKAALEGFRDVGRVRIKVFYPADGVSRVQKLQMATQSGSNVGVYGIRGNFDDAQTAVKKAFADRKLAERLSEKGWFLSSANSINWGRLVPQIVYYYSAYCDLVKSGAIRLGEKINFCVPTGNFGDIFAGYLAMRSGLPVRRLICASNSNNVLTDFFRGGTYDRNREFRTTISPSMDILISSNLERLLYYTAGPEYTASWMRQLSEAGRYRTDASTYSLISNSFSGYYADEEQTETAIRRTFEDLGVLIDPHTAVGVCCAGQYRAETGDGTLTVCLSTASPFKFAQSVYRAITYCKPSDGYEALEEVSVLTGVPIPAPLAGLNERKIRFERTIRPSELQRAVLEDL